MEEQQFWVMARGSWDWGLGLNRGEGPWGGGAEALESPGVGCHLNRCRRPSLG